MKTINLIEKRGNLSFMVSWISLDGSPQISYFDTFEEAKRQAIHLNFLGRVSAIFYRIDVAQP